MPAAAPKARRAGAARVNIRGFGNMDRTQETRSVVAWIDARCARPCRRRSHEQMPSRLSVTGMLVRFGTAPKLQNPPPPSPPANRYASKNVVTGLGFAQ